MKRVHFLIAEQNFNNRKGKKNKEQQPEQKDLESSTFTPYVNEWTFTPSSKNVEVINTLTLFRF